VLLTHAHLDHCGRLPLLPKRGFRGEVIATAATFDLARLVILDSAHLQLEDARHQLRAEGRGQGGQTEEPLYSMIDALDAIGRFGRAAAYRRPVALATGLDATFFDAGHILGSGSILFELEEHGRRCSLLFSGDIGNRGRPLLRDPETPGSADFVIMETTYGNRAHRAFSESVAEFYEAINETLARGGNVLIPTFALERTQDVLYFLRQGIEQKQLLPSLSVFLDSPMAISTTEVFRRHPESCAEGLGRSLTAGNDPFSLPGLTLARETVQSIAINRITGGSVIMAGSGMCTGGRIRHHLANNLDRPAAGIIFVGFAAEARLRGASSMERRR